MAEGKGHTELLDWLDGIAENGAKDKRKALNPILLAAAAKKHAKAVRAGDTDNQIALKLALDLAVTTLSLNEPGDSRAVSDEFVALSAVLSGDTSKPVMDVIDKAIVRLEVARIEQLPPFAPQEESTSVDSLVEALDGALEYLRGSNPLNMSGGHKNVDLREQLDAALSRFRSLQNGGES